MSKLLVAGLVLTAGAVSWEPSVLEATRSYATRPVKQTLQPGSFVRPGLEEIGKSFESLVADRVKETLSRTEQEMQLLAPQITQSSGPLTIELKQLADQFNEASAKARQHLVDGHTLVALDFANQANSRVAEIKRRFERR